MLTCALKTMKKWLRHQHGFALHLVLFVCFISNKKFKKMVTFKTPCLRANFSPWHIVVHLRCGVPPSNQNWQTSRFYSSQKFHVHISVRFLPRSSTQFTVILSFSVQRLPERSCIYIYIKASFPMFRSGRKEAHWNPLMSIWL